MCVGVKTSSVEVSGSAWIHAQFTAAPFSGSHRKAEPRKMREEVWQIQLRPERRKVWAQKLGVGERYSDAARTDPPGRAKVCSDRVKNQLFCLALSAQFLRTAFSYIRNQYETSWAAKDEKLCPPPLRRERCRGKKKEHGARAGVLVFDGEVTRTCILVLRILVNPSASTLPSTLCGRTW